MRKSTIALLLVASMVTAGCLGSVSGARISQSTLDESGWSKTSDQTKGVAMGLGELENKEYQPSSSSQGTGAIVATTNDVPILDESRFIPQALERVEKQRNIELQKSGTTEVSLPELGVDAIEAQLYTFQKSGANGKLILFTPDQCDGFVVAAGYGITGGGGVAAPSPTYQTAKDVARGVVCG